PTLAGQFAQGVADNAARLPEPGKRRGVEIANPGRPSRLYNRLSFFSCDRDPVPTEGSGAEPEDRQSEGREPQMACLEAHHAVLSVDAYRLILYPITTRRVNRSDGRLL